MEAGRVAREKQGRERLREGGKGWKGRIRVARERGLLELGTDGQTWRVQKCNLEAASRP